MTTIAALIGSDSPKKVQIVVSATTLGTPWVVTGSAGGSEWVVPGGRGVGDGGQLVLADNRGPVNVPITYKYSGAAVETAAPVTRVADGDVVLQSLDGQKTVTADLMLASKDTDLEVRNALFSVPGRRRMVGRYSVTGAGGGVLVVRVPVSQSAAFDDLMSDGAPLIWLLGQESFDFPLVSAFTITRASSNGLPRIGKREWSLTYVLSDDPFMDKRLGVFSWVDFDSAMSARTWPQFDTVFAGKPWNLYDTQDWDVL